MYCSKSRYMTPRIELIGAVITVSLINKFILHNSIMWQSCSPQAIVIEHEDTVSSSNTTISDTSLDTPHVHAH